MFKKRSITLLLYVFISSIAVSCGPKIYTSPSFTQQKSTIQKVAILPFNVTIDSKRLPKGMTVETLKEAQISTGYNLQSSAYSWLLRRQNDFTTTFQDVDRTNALLKGAGLTYDDLLTTDKGELCQLLGVDAVMSGKMVTSRPMSDGAAIAMTILVGYGSTNKATAALNIHDTNGELLWKYDHTADGGVASSSEAITNWLMKNSSKKFPFRIE